MIVKGQAEWLLGALDHKRMELNRDVASAGVASNQQLLVVLGKVRTISAIVSKAFRANGTVHRSSSAF